MVTIFEVIYIKKLKIYFIAGISAILSMIIFSSGILDKYEVNLSDNFFQSEQPLDGTITVIGIDSKSLEELGPFSEWPRSYMAQAVENLTLNKENQPAVIGIDVMYFGNTDRREDNSLVAACLKGDSIITASLANFSSKMITDEAGNFYMKNNYVDRFEEPFQDLQSVTIQGHVNTLPDNDGIVRRSLQYITLEDGEKVNSFAYEVYRQYAEKNGIDVSEIKEELWYIPYSSKPGGYYDGYSFIDVMNGRIDPKVFENRIVLIGPYATGLMDSYITSVDHNSQMYGVEIHANIIDALIKGDFKSEANKNIQYFLIFVIVFASIVLFNKLKFRHSIIFLILFTVGYWGIACLMYHFADCIFDVLYIPVFVVISFIASVGAKYVKANIEKRRVEGTFKRYVAPQVVDKIIKDGIENINLGGAKTDIACLFVDIRGFTTMSEALNPEDVVGILNEYLNLTSSCIFNNDGTLDKFIGDATMAIFNAPLPLEDYVYKAVKTAWEIAKGSEELKEKLQAKFGKSVSFGIGVNCGEAVVGNIGTKIRMDYTAIGDTVNTAARLESNAKPGQILISKEVYDRLQGRIKASSIGEIPLKGKSNGIEVYILDEIKY